MALAICAFVCTTAAASGEGATGSEPYPRIPADWLEAQIALARRGFSCGSIDGGRGPKSIAALRSFQASEGLPVSGELDPPTRDRLRLSRPPLNSRSFSSAELGALQPLSPSWIGRSRQTALGYQTALEMAAEEMHASPWLVRRLNPDVDWTQLTPTTAVVGPDAAAGPRPRADRLVISLGARSLTALDARGRVIAFFPVSIGRRVDRPLGEMRVAVKVRNPAYTFDPAVFPESAEAQAVGHRLTLPPGPNNPVGLVWIGLDRPRYGIHGTPDPEQVGRTESHGCFRLTNWDALTLLDMVSIGLPVRVEP
jgi:lipoprotein-anchoring transpeptidase ErfK/SrfK